MNMKEITLASIKEFTRQEAFAIAGVSRNKNKFGSALYRDLKKHGYKVFPVNPNMDTFEGDVCYKDIASLPEETGGIVIATSPGHTVQLINDAKTKGIKHIWLQMGAENPESIEIAQNDDLNIIYKKCVFMYMEPVKFPHSFHRSFVKLFGRYPK